MIEGAGGRERGGSVGRRGQEVEQRGGGSHINYLVEMDIKWEEKERCKYTLESLPCLLDIRCFQLPQQSFC